MTPDEQKILYSIETDVKSIKTWITGDPEHGHRGIVPRLEKVESVAESNEAAIGKVKWLAASIGGLGIGGGGLAAFWQNIFGG